MVGRLRPDQAQLHNSVLPAAWSGVSVPSLRLGLVEHPCAQPLAVQRKGRQGVTMLSPLSVPSLS